MILKPLTSDLKALNPTIDLRTLEGFAFLIQSEMAAIFPAFEREGRAWPHGLLVAECDPTGKSRLSPEVYLFSFEFTNDEEKAAKIEEVRAAARHLHAFGLILVLEVWARFMSLEEGQTIGFKMRPSQDPERKEMVMCTTEFALEDMRKCWATEILATDDGGKRLGRWEPMAEVIDGALSRLLPTYVVPTMN